MSSSSVLTVELLELLLGGDAKLLLLVDHEQPQVVKFHPFAYELVGAYDDVDFARGQVGKHLFHLFGLAGAAQVVDGDGKVLEPLAEGAEVLEGEHGSGHEHGGLLAVDSRLEGRPDGHLGLAEAHIAAHQAVHGSVALHVGFHGLCGLELVGGVLIDERSLELLLQIAVGTEGETLLLAALGIELDQVAGDVLELALGARLHLVPGAAAQLAQPRFHALLSAVLGELVQGVYRDKDDVAVEIHQLYHLLHGAVDLGAHQAAKLAYAVVFVHDVVAHLDRVELLKGEGQLAAAGAVALEAVLVEAVKDLMVGEYTQLQVVVDKALVQGLVDGGELDVVVAVVEDGAQALDLLGRVAQDHDFVALAQEVVERLADEVEILVEYALRAAVQAQPCIGLAGALAVAQVDAPEAVEAGQETRHVDHLFHGFGVALVGHQGILRERFLAYGLDAAPEPLHVAAGEHRLGLDVLEQRGAAVDIAGVAVDQRHALDAGVAQLGLHVEGAYTVDFVAEEVDAVGQLVAVAIHVEDAAAHHGRALYWIVAVIAALLLWWLIRFDAGRHEVGDKISEIRTTAEVAERRADVIVDAAKQREEAIRDETVKQVQSASDDALPDLLAGLLRDWREGK